MDMQARRDNFTLLTDEKAPDEPKRWLVTWGKGDRFMWREAVSAHWATGFSLALDEPAQVHDLDNQ